MFATPGANIFYHKRDKWKKAPTSYSLNCPQHKRKWFYYHRIIQMLPDVLILKNKPYVASVCPTLCRSTSRLCLGLRRTLIHRLIILSGGAERKQSTSLVCLNNWWLFYFWITSPLIWMSESADLCREAQFAVWDEEDLFLSMQGQQGFLWVVLSTWEREREHTGIDFMVLHGSTCHCSVSV